MRVKDFDLTCKKKSFLSVYRLTLNKICSLTKESGRKPKALKIKAANIFNFKMFLSETADVIHNSLTHTSSPTQGLHCILLVT